MKTGFSGRGAIEVSRFKGLGEMPMRDLRDTTMDPARRALLRVAIVEDDARSDRRHGRAADGHQAGGALRLHPGAGAAGARTRRHLSAAPATRCSLPCAEAYVTCGGYSRRRARRHAELRGPDVEDEPNASPTRIVGCCRDLGRWLTLLVHRHRPGRRADSPIAVDRRATRSYVTADASRQHVNYAPKFNAIDYSTTGAIKGQTRCHCRPAERGDRGAAPRGYPRDLPIKDASRIDLAKTQKNEIGS